ncbi:MAG: hypothetical protein WAZ14_00695 [Patescibacteria group bacterium]
MIDRKMLLPGIALLLAGAGCTASSDFPILTGDPAMGEKGYYVCESEHGRIYETSQCGDDSCGRTFYSGGVIIETVPHGPGNGDPTPETKVENCQRTTQEYFTSQVQE